MYIAARGTSAATMTPYDVAAVRSRDGMVLAGTPPDDLQRYLDVLRADPAAGAAGMLVPGGIRTAADVVSLVERSARVRWAEAEARARAAGALVGAYPAEA